MAVKDVPLTEAPPVAPEPEFVGTKIWSLQHGYRVQFGEKCIEFTPETRLRFRSGAYKLLMIGGSYVTKSVDEDKFFAALVAADSNLSYTEKPQDED